MRYYVTADTHGYYTILHQALNTAGFFEDEEPHKLIIQITGSGEKQMDAVVN